MSSPFFSSLVQYAGQVVPLGGSKSYAGVQLSSAQVSSALHTFAKHAPESVFADAVQNQQRRDGGSTWHMTVFTPEEFRNPGVRRVMPLIGKVSFSPVGLGWAQAGERETWYIVCRSPEVDEIRSELGLSKHDLHVTLGFIKSEIHNVPKGEETIFSPLEM